MKFSFGRFGRIVSYRCCYTTSRESSCIVDLYCSQLGTQLNREAVSDFQPASALAGRINCQGMQQILICVTRYGEWRGVIRGFYEIRRILIDISFFFFFLLSSRFLYCIIEYRIMKYIQKKKKIEVEIFLKGKIHERI